jgi:CheY-like chemotaxis protein
MSSRVVHPVEDSVRRILVVDDTPGIHDDFRKILCRKRKATALLAAADSLFAKGDGAQKGRGAAGPSTSTSPVRRPEHDEFVVDSAMQGREGYEMVARMLERGTPYALAFVDMRMPPGWDGVETLSRIFGLDPSIEAVVCTAFSDYSSVGMGKLSRPDLRLLTKPFDSKDVLDLAWTLTNRWQKRRGISRSTPPGGRP